MPHKYMLSENFSDMIFNQDCFYQKEVILEGHNFGFAITKHFQMGAKNYS